MRTAIHIHFDRGTLLVNAPPEDTAWLGASSVLLWDPRVAAWRAPAFRYAEVLRTLSTAGAPVVDHVGPPSSFLGTTPGLRSYQTDALNAWELAGHTGLVVLPTGSGKTRVALAAIAKAGLATIILVPTRALLGQWVERLGQLGPEPVGVVGDGHRDVRTITVCTFESALRRMDDFGDRFGLLVVDEAHHFASGARSEALEMSPARMRLGLTATPPADEGGRAMLADLIGPVVCERSVAEFLGTHLAPMERVIYHVDLTPAERAEYVRLYEPFRAAVRGFMRTDPNRKYVDFVRAASRSAGGRQLLEGQRRGRKLVAGCRAKHETAARLLHQHAGERVLIFTGDNRVAYKVSETLLVPAITCDIKASERETVLGHFRDGRVRGLVSSQVLNEGLDVPDAGIAVILGGRLGAREHIQRVGRVLRPKPGKTAIVYEVVVARTFEDRQTQRRGLALAGRSALAC